MHLEEVKQIGDNKGKIKLDQSDSKLESLVLKTRL